MIQSRLTLGSIIILVLMTLTRYGSNPVLASLLRPATTGSLPAEITRLPVSAQASTATPTPTPVLTPTLTLPVLMGTPVPLPNEPITPDNVDQLQQLVMWGKGQVKQITYSPDGQLLAVGTSRGIWLHDAKTLELHRFIQTNSEIVTMAFLSDSQLIAQVGGKLINRWDITTGTLVGSWQVGVFDLKNVAFASDGKILASALEDGQIGFWDIASGQLLRTSAGHPHRLAGGLTFSPDGSLLASSTNDHTVKVWEVQTGALWRDLQGQPDPVTMLARSITMFSSDGKLLASGYDNAIRLWDIETGTLLKTLVGHTASVESLRFSPDSKLLASGGDDRTARLWDVTGGNLQHTFTDYSNWVTSLAFSPDGAVLASGEQFGGTVRLWQVQSGAALGPIEGYQSVVNAIAVAPNNLIFIANSQDNEIQIWDITQGKMVRTLAGHSSPITHLAISADGNTLVSNEKEGQSAWIWNLTTGQHIQSLGSYTSMTLRDLSLSPDGLVMASTESSVLEILDVRTGEELNILRSPTRGDAVTDPVFSSDGRLASRSSSEAYLLNAKDGELLRTIRGSVGYRGLAISPDNKTLAVGNDDGTITLWDVAKPEQKIWVDIVGHKARVVNIRFSFSGSILAAAYENSDTTRREDAGALLLWEAKTNKLLRTVEIPAVLGMYFTPDDRMLVFQLRDGTVQFWGVPDNH